MGQSTEKRARVLHVRKHLRPLLRWPARAELESVTMMAELESVTIMPDLWGKHRWDRCFDWWRAHVKKDSSKKTKQKHYKQWKRREPATRDSFLQEAMEFYRKHGRCKLSTGRYACHALDLHYFNTFEKSNDMSCDYIQSLVSFIQNVQLSRKEPNLELETTENLFIQELDGANGWLLILEQFDLHWRIRNYQSEKHAEALSNPAAGTLYILWDFKENLNLPLLKEEMNGAYYANARLTTSLCTLRVWKADHKPHYMTYISRVLEKSTAFAFTYA